MSNNGDAGLQGALTVGTDLVVPGEADIARVPPRGGISMGIYTADGSDAE